MNLLNCVFSVPVCFMIIVGGTAVLFCLIKKFKFEQNLLWQHCNAHEILYINAENAYETVFKITYCGTYIDQGY